MLDIQKFREGKFKDALCPLIPIDSDAPTARCWRRGVYLVIGCVHFHHFHQ
jgi:hypothetical protein